MGPKQWYWVRTKPGHESRVRRRILERAANQGLLAKFGRLQVAPAVSSGVPEPKQRKRRPARPAASGRLMAEVELDTPTRALIQETRWVKGIDPAHEPPHPPSEHLPSPLPTGAKPNGTPRVVLYDQGSLQQGGEELLDKPGLKWIDIQPPTLEVLGRIAQRFGLHRLEVEDCLHLDQRPKLEEYPGHLFVVLHGFSGETGFGDPTLHEMHCFLGPDWIITVHELASDAVVDGLRRISADPAGTMGRGVDFVLYLVADALVDRNFPLMDAFNDELEELELQIFEGARQEHLHRAFKLKRTLIALRRVMSPQRDVVGLLARRGMLNVQERTTLYFRDVYDHLVRLYEQIDANRDMVGNAMEGYLSAVANKTNEITKQLTIFATIFLPLSFITGFFGQNFPALGGPGFFVLMLALVLLLPGVLIWWFRRKQWL